MQFVVFVFNWYCYSCCFCFCNLPIQIMVSNVMRCVLIKFVCSCSICICKVNAIEKKCGNARRNSISNLKQKKNIKFTRHQSNWDKKKWICMYEYWLLNGFVKTQLIKFCLVSIEAISLVASLDHFWTHSG